MRSSSGIGSESSGSHRGGVESYEVLDRLSKIRSRMSLPPAMTQHPNLDTAASMGDIPAATANRLNIATEDSDNLNTRQRSEGSLRPTQQQELESQNDESLQESLNGRRSAQQIERNLAARRRSIEALRERERRMNSYSSQTQNERCSPQLPNQLHASAAESMCLLEQNDAVRQLPPVVVSSSSPANTANPLYKPLSSNPSNIPPPYLIPKGSNNFRQLSLQQQSSEFNFSESGNALDSRKYMHNFAPNFNIGESHEVQQIARGTSLNYGTDQSLVEMKTKIETFLAVQKKYEGEIGSLKSELRGVQKQQQQSPSFIDERSSLVNPRKAELPPRTVEEFRSIEDKLLDERDELRDKNERLANENEELIDELRVKDEEIRKQRVMFIELRQKFADQQEQLSDCQHKLLEGERGLDIIRKNTEIEEKIEEIHQLQRTRESDCEQFEEAKAHMNEENSEILLKAGRLLQKYKLLEKDYTDLQRKVDNEDSWRLKTEEKDAQLRIKTREIELLQSTAVKELEELKRIFHAIALNFKEHSRERLLDTILRVAADNRKHAAFEEQFYAVLGSEELNSRSTPLGAARRTPEQSWNLFQKIILEYIELRRQERMDAKLGKLLMKSLEAKDREEVIPKFTQIVLQNQTLSAILNKIKVALRLPLDCDSNELSTAVDRLIQKRIFTS